MSVFLIVPKKSKDDNKKTGGGFGDFERDSYRNEDTDDESDQED